MKNELSNRPLTLTDVYNQKLNALLAAEKKYLKCFRKLAAASFTNEIRSGLSPASTDQEQHIERLQQCRVLIKLKGRSAVQELDEFLLNQANEACKGATKKTLYTDMQILHCSQTILHVKISAYQVLERMAAALGQDHAALLLGQCFKDNQNSYGYLVQISQNIIYPKAMNDLLQDFIYE